MCLSLTCFPPGRRMQEYWRGCQRLPLRGAAKIFDTSLKKGGKKAPNSSFLDYLWSRGPKDAQGSTSVCYALSAATRRWSRGPKDVRYPPSVRDALAGRPAARIVSGDSPPNNRKPCHPEHSVSDFGFHDCRWQSYLRKMRSSFDSLSLLRMTAFLKCLNLCSKRSICRFVYKSHKVFH